MEITLEQVERLREKSGLSYEEAKTVLEEAEGSLLDALILLERQGRLGPGSGQSAHYSTRTGGEAGAGTQDQQRDSGGEDARFFGFAVTVDEKQGRHFVQDLLRRGTENCLEVRRREELVVSVPLIITILLLVLAFWVCVPLLVIGLLTGCRYQFAGPDFDRSPAGDAVNRAARTVGERVEQVRDQARTYFHENHRGKK